ncbi:MAG: hypothetical protein HYT39_03625 [Candidatus Sungbacteria bacterium]|nr:hypothetical protein [Candidatus Sungbacteria bacterium]
MAFEISISSPSLWPLPFRYATVFRLLRSFGFKGVEMLLTTGVLKTHRQLVASGDKMGLGLTFHRWWHDPLPVSRVMTALKFFPQPSVRLRDVLPGNFPRPVVLGSYIWEERHDVSRVLIQPVCYGHEGTVMPLATLVAKIKEEQLGVAFDVMHWLEYALGRDLPNNPSRLLAEACRGFDALHPLVDEIHLYDFSQGKQGGLRWVKTTCWAGRVVWEISPVQVVKKPWRLPHLSRVTVQALGL